MSFLSVNDCDDPQNRSLNRLQQVPEVNFSEDLSSNQYASISSVESSDNMLFKSLQGDRNTNICKRKQVSKYFHIHATYDITSFDTEEETDSIDLPPVLHNRTLEGNSAIPASVVCNTNAQNKYNFRSCNNTTNKQKILSVLEEGENFSNTIKDNTSKWSNNRDMLWERRSIGSVDEGLHYIKDCVTNVSSVSHTAFPCKPTMSLFCIDKSIKKSWQSSIFSEAEDREDSYEFEDSKLAENER